MSNREQKNTEDTTHKGNAMNTDTPEVPEVQAEEKKERTPSRVEKALERTRMQLVPVYTTQGWVWLRKKNPAAEATSVVLNKESVIRSIKLGSPIQAVPTSVEIENILDRLVGEEEARQARNTSATPAEVVERWWSEGTATELEKPTYIYRGNKDTDVRKPFYRISAEGVTETETMSSENTVRACGVVHQSDGFAELEVDLSAEISDIEQLWGYINVLPAHRHMILGALISSWVHHAADRPIFFTSGPQNSGKTITTQRLAYLVNPRNHSGETTLDTRNGVAAIESAVQGSETLVIGNISSISRPVSDRLCQVVSGSTQVTRKLYTEFDKAESSSRATIFISTKEEEIALEPDLLSRMIPIIVNPLTEKQRNRRLREQEWQEVVPRIRGGLFKLVAAVKAHRVNQPLLQVPNDFRWEGVAEVMHRVDAVLEQEGVKVKPWNEALEESREVVGMKALPTVIEWIVSELSKEVEGTPGGVLQELQGLAVKGTSSNSKSWGKLSTGWSINARTFMSQLRSYKDVIEEAGVLVNLKQVVGGKKPRYKVSLVPVASAEMSEYVGDNIL